MDIRRLFRWPRVNAAGGAGADGSWWPSYPNQNSDSVAQFAQYPPRAMRLPAVRRAVTAISSDLARMPIRAYIYNGDEWTDIGRDPIVIALTEQASEYHTSADFKRWMFTQCLTWGNSFALISRRGTSFDQFIPLNNSDVQMNRANEFPQVKHCVNIHRLKSADVWYSLACSVNAITIGSRPMSVHSSPL